MAITRTAMTDDDGSGTTGTIINNAWKIEFYDQIDAALVGKTGEVVGTFLPRLQADTYSGQVYTTQSGQYIKIGHLVYVSGRITLSNKGTMAGGMLIGNLPFPATTVVEPFVAISGLTIGYFAGLASPLGTLLGYIGPGTTNFYLMCTFESTAVTPVTDAHISNTFDIMFGGTYYAA
jgi:hypothetical protein